jgi:hypothetical protein
MALRPVKLLVLTLVWFVALPARSRDGANPDLETARALYQNLRYAAAAEQLQQALRIRGSSREQLIEIYRLLGMSQAVLENEREAQEAFSMLLSLDPGADLDTDLSPKILDLFKRVKARFQPRVVFSPRPVAWARSQARLEVGLADSTRSVVAVRLWLLRAGGAFQNLLVDCAGANSFALTLPVQPEAVPPAGLTLKIYWEALDAGGNLVAVQGTQARPEVIKIPGPPDEPGLPPASLAAIPPAATDLSDEEPGTESESPAASRWYQKWWVWTLVGVVASGVTVGVVLGTRGNDVPGGSLDDIVLNGR